MNTAISDQHLTDAEVSRAVDAQLDADERTRVEAHLAHCDTCRAMLTRAETRTRRLSALLQRTDFDVPPMSVSTKTGRDILDFRAREKPVREAAAIQPWMRAAAVIALLIGGLFAIPPVRAAIIGWVRAQFSDDARESAAPGVAAPSAPNVQPDLGAAVQFVPAGEVLYVELMSADEQGTIELKRGTGDRVSARVDNGSVEMIVLTDGLRINNAGAQQLRYRIEAPQSVETIVVTVAGRNVARISGAQIDAGLTVKPASR
jgi:anti-sigma factor RsiW